MFPGGNYRADALLSSPGQEIKPSLAPAVFGDRSYVERALFYFINRFRARDTPHPGDSYSLMLIVWAAFASTLTPGPIVDASVIRLI